MHERAGRRGFTLLTVVLLIALVTSAAVVVVDMVGIDFGILAGERHGREAREVAEGGLMEVLNDQEVMANLPGLGLGNLRREHHSAPGGHLYEGAGSKRYSATIELVRIAPMLESSHMAVRAVVYQVDVTGHAADRASAGVQAEVYKVASARPGMIQPRMHAR